MRDAILGTVVIGLLVALLFVAAGIYDLVKFKSIKDCKGLVDEAIEVYDYGATILIEQKILGVTFRRIITAPCVRRPGIAKPCDRE